MTGSTFPESAGYDWLALVADLNALLRLKTTITGMKLFERIEDMQAIPRIRRPQAVHTTDQVVSRPPHHLPLAIEGLKALSKTGIRYPIASYGIQNDVRAGLVSVYKRPARS